MSSRLLAVSLMCMMLLGLGFAIYFYNEWFYAYSSLMQAQMESQWLQSTLSYVNATAPRVTVNLTFTPTPPTKTVASNSITFLTGYVTVTNLTGIFYPATLTVNFTVTHTAPLNTIVTYSYIPYQTVYLTQGIQYIEIPWGIFPLEIHGNPGDQIIISANARVTITWTYVNAVMANQTVTATYTIYIGA